ncbi:HAD-IA family hydrolase [Escherichia coli]|nr:HAD-IA family hydrolase [Escherichia coli]
MKALIWNSPWFAQGDLLFYKNCFVKHLLPQANLLNSIGYDVDVITHDLISDTTSNLNRDINVINLKLENIIDIVGVLSDPSKELYDNPNGLLSIKIANKLKEVLSAYYDVIFLWETPVPFLENLFPEALIIHQMPGAFCRAPYPHMVTFDPVGLYKHGSLYKYFESIITDDTVHNSESVNNFSEAVKNAINAITPFNYSDLDHREEYNELILLPLQTSGHYAFLSDTPYISQSDFLIDVLNNTPSKSGIVVTQYVTPKVKDTILTPEALSVIKKKWPNIIFNEKFDKINSVSQYLLPFVDKIVSCSSSLAIQALVWQKDISVPHDTFIKKLSSDYLKRFDIEQKKIYSSVLDFIINKQQPLASKILKDGDFLRALLDEMIKRKKSGKKGIDLFVDFNTIDPNYSSDLLNQFNISRAEKDVRKTDELMALQNADALKLERIVKREELEHITFDVFDTLINRPVETPADVYKFLETIALKISNGLTEDFYRARLTAEVETRNNSQKGEITLDDIYSALQKHYQLTDDIKDKIMHAEIELEISLIEARPAGKRLWEAAKRTGRPISIISDMYLPEFAIERMLTKAGYSGYDKLFVSSTYGVRKKEGGLFDVVLDELGIPPEKIIHIGDNVAADIKMPRSKGMLSFRIVRALDRMRNNKHYYNIFSPKKGVGEKPRSIIAGLIAAKLFDNPLGDLGENTLFLGKPYNLGYAALGPMLSSFVQWIIRQSKNDGLQRIYFLSREGWILKQVYDIYTKDDNESIPSVYLYCSRRTVRVASIRSINDILNVASQPFSSGVTISQLLNYRFGLEEKYITEEKLISAGFNTANDILESDNITKIKFSKLCQSLSKEIIDQATSERNTYIEYLNQVGIFDHDNSGIVDIGWKANMQGSLGELIDKKFIGYYYATLQGAEKWLDQGHTIKSFIGDFLSVESKSCAVNNRHLIEFLTCHTDRSLVCMTKGVSGKIIKHFRDEPMHSNRVKLIDEIHAGITNFAHDMKNRFGDIANQSYCDWSLGEKVLDDFIKSPTKEDVLFLVGQAFEDSFGGVSKKYVIANKPNQISVFNKGADIYFLEEKKKGVKKDKNVPHIEKTTIANNPTKPPAHTNSTKNIENVITSVPKIYLNIEKATLKLFSNPKKYNKYTKNRDAFFLDSRKKLLTKWYKLTTRQINM